MRCEVVAVGTELLLGQIVNTNAAWLGERFAMAGIGHHFQTVVGDNLERMVDALRAALARSDAVVVCGGLGPTQDDITREAIAEVMQAELVRDEEVADVIRHLFESRGRSMPESNLRQADVPVGATVIPQSRGTAPGLICPVGHKVVYAVPGVPFEMEARVERAVIPDLCRRSGTTATIRSRVLRTWGMAESAVAERVAPRVEALDTALNPTIAFLASGVEGIKVRITAMADSVEKAEALLDAEEAELRGLLGRTVFGIDHESMEHAVGTLLSERGWTMATAESMTGGLIASRVVGVAGSSEWFRGGVVAYASEVKFGVLSVPEGPVVSGECAAAMASGARTVLGADVGLSVTGVAGPARQEDQPVGTVFFGVALPDGEPSAIEVHLPGDREQVRQFAAISALDHLRRRLLDLRDGD